MGTTFTETELPGVLLCEPDCFGDSRGFFMETFHAPRYQEAGIDLPFVQDNLSRSSRGTLRGIHWQRRHPQGKLVYVLSGAVVDVVADIRKGSPTFGQSVAMELSDENRRQLYIPPGYAHGFQVLSERADFCYKCTAVYDPEDQYGITWNDPTLNISWPLADPILSDKDQKLPQLSELSEADQPGVTIHLGN